MIEFAPAKINIGLYVTSKRPDGFHNIETIFYPVPLYDVLEITESSEFKLREYGIVSGCNYRENLCFRAWELLKSNVHVPHVEIQILKNIPVQAGLGGGSSDAVAVLKALNTMFHLNITDEMMYNFALQLGSDCPFFIKQQAVYATSRGEKFTNIDVSLRGKTIVIFKPEKGISTKEAFAKLQKHGSGELLSKIKQPVSSWKDSIENVFEDVFIQSCPEYAEFKAELYNSGALFVSLSGSGSSFFAIFDNEHPVIPVLLKNIFFRKLLLE